MFEVHRTRTDFFHEIRIPRTNLKLKKKFIFFFKKKNFYGKGYFLWGVGSDYQTW
jgi:hypothetical protein